MRIGIGECRPDIVTNEKALHGSSTNAGPSSEVSPGTQFEEEGEKKRRRSTGLDTSRQTPRRDTITCSTRLKSIYARPKCDLTTTFCPPPTMSLYTTPLARVPRQVSSLVIPLRCFAETLGLVVMCRARLGLKAPAWRARAREILKPGPRWRLRLPARPEPRPASHQGRV